MRKVYIFGRGEIKRLSWELRHEQLRHQETEREANYLRGVKTSQSAVIDRLMQEIRAQDELIRQLQATEKKLFAMYTESEKARQGLARRAQEGAGGSEPLPAVEKEAAL